MSFRPIDRFPEFYRPVPEIPSSIRDSFPQDPVPGYEEFYTITNFVRQSLFCIVR